MEKKKYLIPVIVIAFVLMALGGAIAVGKQAFASNQSNMAGKLAEKLNVPEDQVSTAMDSIRTERHAERAAEISTNLDKAVADGVITAEQKQQILDQKTKQEQFRKENEQWKTDSGIDFDKLRDYHVGLGNGMGMGGRGHGKGME